jgi:predicted permease
MLADLFERLRALLLRNRVEADMDEEMRFHIERETEERIRHGIEPQRARREALLAFGGVERRKEEVRDARGVSALENAGADLRHAARALRRNPIFAATAVVVLTLGVGASAAVYGVAHAVLLADLPFPEPDRIVRIYQKYSETTLFGLSVVDVQAIAQQQRSFASIGAMRPGEATIATPEHPTPERRGIGRATAGMFKVLGVRPAAGRFFEERDEAAGADPVVVLSHALAVRWFGDAPAAVGERMTLDGVGHTIVGVLPSNVPDLAGFRGAAWRVFRMDPPTRRGPFGIRVLARLRPGATVESATRDLASISETIFPIWKSSFRDSTAKLTPVPLRAAVLGDQTERRIGVLAAGVSLVLLAAIANVAMLVLVRVSSRESELAIRSALGAGRWRLARLLAAEGLLLGMLSAAGGFALAYFLLKLAPATLPTIPRIREAGADWRVAGAAALLALLAAAVATVTPVLSALARPTTTSIAERRVGSSRRSNLARRLLIAAEFGLALPLLAGAGLLLNSFLRLQRVDPGYDPEGAVAVSIGLPPTRYPEPESGALFWRQLEQRLRESPVVAAVGLSGSLPPSEPGDINNFDLKDRPVPPGGAEHVAPWNTVTNGYFETLRIPLLEGRLFTPADTVFSPPERTRSVVLVSRSWAKKYYPDVSAVGRQMIAGGCTTCEPTTVIGVVGDVKYQGLAQSSEAVYSPVTQNMQSSMSLVLRTRAGATPAAAFAAVREIVRSLDPQIALTETTLRREIDESLADPKRWTSVLGAFSLTGVLLATVGIFGLMAYTVRQRRREIGVCMALGATASAVVWNIVASGLRWAAAGSAAGLALALTSGRWIRTFLFDVEANDPFTLGGVLVALLVTAAFACWLAARRAARINPVEAIAAN